MATRDKIAITGHLTIELRDRMGQLIETRRHRNLITLGGRRVLARYFAGQLQTNAGLEMAIGTSSEPPTVDDTGLGAPVEGERGRQPAELHYVPEAEIEGERYAVVRVEALFPLDDDLAEPIDPDTPTVLPINEAGILMPGELPGDPAVLFNHVQFETIHKGGNLEMRLVWELAF